MHSLFLAACLYSQNRLSNRIFETYDAIIDAGYEARNKLIAQPQTINSIGMRDWAYKGQCQWRLVLNPWPAIVEIIGSEILTKPHITESIAETF